MNKLEKPGIVLQPQVHHAWQQGITQLDAAIRPTLGPVPRLVAIEGTSRAKAPELLDSGATIARRIIQLANRDADMGAMYLREMLWQVQTRAGDGTATAAVLFASVFNQGVRHIAGGGNAMLLRRHLEAALPMLMQAVDDQAVPLGGEERLAQFAETVLHDPPLAEAFGEVFDVLGEHGRLDIRADTVDQVRCEYVEGSYWEEGVLAREMLPTASTLAELENAAVLLTDLAIDDMHELARLLTDVVRSGVGALLIVCPSLSQQVLAFLAANRLENFRVLAVKTPGSTALDQFAALEDMAILSGAMPCYSATGAHLSSVRVKHLGRVRRAWANATQFGIVSGKGDTIRLRQHIASLQAAFKRANNVDDCTRIRERLGKLQGGSATLWVGGWSESVIKTRIERAKNAAMVLRDAIREGVVPGGGMAFLMARRKLLAMPCNDEQQRFAHCLIADALCMPMRTIIMNAGYEPASFVDQAITSGCGFDVHTGKTVDVMQAGIIDSVAVLKEALRAAISSAALALTVDVLIHHKRPEIAVKP